MITNTVSWFWDNASKFLSQLFQKNASGGQFLLFTVYTVLKNIENLHFERTRSLTEKHTSFWPNNKQHLEPEDKVFFLVSCEPLQSSSAHCYFSASCLKVPRLLFTNTQLVESKDMEGFLQYLVTSSSSMASIFSWPYLNITI